ncbi:10862_t:CDS:2 [Diversispora eburnea]|uniref:10862_t:CDS:1 n=1 Tax=Diversispora eburnea TaxID=1213867 RepID=A0A9N9AC03_9GLOM|nr:10862_t:CDS:2 [Diversispora eburnea]
MTFFARVVNGGVLRNNNFRVNNTFVTSVRHYAAETSASNNLKLSFALPHQLKPGIIEITENPNSTKKYFVSGGFAVMNSNSSLDINAVEAFPLDDFSIENIARVEIDVYEALQSAIGKSS